MKKSLESNKPSAPPLCQGPSGTDLKGEEGGGEVTEYCNIAFAEKHPSYRSIMGGGNPSLASTFLVLKITGQWIEKNKDECSQRMEGGLEQWCGRMLPLQPQLLALPSACHTVHCC